MIPPNRLRLKLVADTVDLRALRPALAARLPDDILQEINRLWTIVGTFSSTAHDLNNALHVIAGSAELLEARDLDPAVRRRVETIRVEAAKAAGTINRLLTYAQSGAAPVQSLDLWPIVERSVEMRLASAGRRRIALSIDRRDPTPCLALVDGVRVQQAVLDLLLAAEDHLGCRRNARIVVRAEREGDTAMVCLNASSEGDAGDSRDDDHQASSADALTRGMQVWAAAHLAEAQRGRVTLTTSDQVLTLTLSVPAASLR